jgi:Cu(I)/Ag(I) efflux system membrane protein CusA/SilA
MIDRVIELSIRNRSLVIVAGLALAVWGVFAVYRTPMDAIPDLSENQVIVFTDWMGHSPREIEDQITYPLSVDLQGLPGVRAVRSSSNFNFSMINVILDDSADFYFARQQVSERLTRTVTFLPPGVSPLLGPDGAATGQIFWYTLEGGGLDLGRLRAIEDWYVKQQLAGVPGVAEVASVGGHAIEYQIDVDPDRLAQHGLTAPVVVETVARANAAVGGYVVEKANAEYIVRGNGSLGAAAAADEDDSMRSARIVRDLEHIVLRTDDGLPICVADVARVSLGAQFRRGVLERDGNEVTGGVVLMRHGENPLEVTRRVREKIHEISAALPPGVRIVPVYDRTGLITSAVATVTGTLVEAILTATVCVVLVLLHFRASLVIAVTLPLATLAAFAAMWTLRQLGIADVQTNIMSLAGIAVSIGVLVDSSIVMAENVLHALHGHFGDRPVRGDVRALVLPACKTVGRPIFFSVMIMLISFLPVFALGGAAGKMFRPLAFTKSIALVAVAVLAVTLVPALSTIFIRGRLRGERSSWLVRGVIDVYRPVLEYLLDRPAPLVWLLGVTWVMGLAPFDRHWFSWGWHWLFLGGLGTAIVIAGSLARTWWGTSAVVTSLVLAGLVAEGNMRPLGWQTLTPLDEGMVMDMPITVPRASITQSTDDLKARDMVLCRFPEVDMVVGKAGRAETPTDPAPLDMIETMVELRPRELWPKRKLAPRDGQKQTEVVLTALIEDAVVEAPPDAAARETLVQDALQESLTRFDGVMREVAYQSNAEFDRELPHQLTQFTVERTVQTLKSHGVLVRQPSPGEIALATQTALAHADHHLAMSPEPWDVERLARHAGHELAGRGLVTGEKDPFDFEPSWLERSAGIVDGLLGRPPATAFSRLHAEVVARHRALWREHVRRLNGDLAVRGPETFTRLAIEELLARATLGDAKTADYLAGIRRLRAEPPKHRHSDPGHHHSRKAAVPEVSVQPQLKALQERLADDFRRWVILAPCKAEEFADPYDHELDDAMKMPGWKNVWTRPIQNRVDMLATGVNTAVGVRVLGRNLDDVVRTAEEIADVLKSVPGAENVCVEQVRGKGYLEIAVDRERCALAGISVGDVNDVIAIAIGGRLATSTVEGRERHPVRVRYARSWREDEETIRRLRIARAPANWGGGLRSGNSDLRRERTSDSNPQSALGNGQSVELADVADVRIVEGPAMIKSENGLLRRLVQLNVRGRSTLEFVDAARRTIAERVTPPEGVHIEWTGQFEYDARAWRTLVIVFPLVLALIFLVLYWTYHDLADAALMMLAVPGALAGGVFFQWLLGYSFSVTVLIGYIACFGMATSTGIIMLVYLREALARAAGAGPMTPGRLRQAVLDGAVQRLRPKLLTEGTTILSLAPMLWATGTGAEVIRPMAAPVLGGILVADEVIDLLLPVLFYWVRRWRLRRGNEGPSGQGAG